MTKVIKFWYDKGLGNADVNAIIPYGGEFWDFVALAWSATLTTNCKAFMAEFGYTSATNSWYYAEVEVPTGGPYPVIINQQSTGLNIGNDFFLSEPADEGTVLCSEILSLAARQLQDLTNVTWPAAILLSYLNVVVKEIVSLKPEANTILGLISMIPGTRQRIPEAWNLLMNVRRNMGADGETPGMAIRQLPRINIDTALPDWHTWTPAAEVLYDILDDRDPFYFDVFPPQPSGTVQKVEAIGSGYPAEVTDPVNGYFPLPTEFYVPCLDGMIYWALNEATTIPRALAKAGTMRQKFLQDMGITKQSEQAVQKEGQ